MELVLPSKEKFIPTFRRKKFLVRLPANESVGLVGVAMSQKSPPFRGICFPIPKALRKSSQIKRRSWGKWQRNFRLPSLAASKDAGSNQDCRPHSILILRTEYKGAPPPVPFLRSPLRSTPGVSRKPREIELGVENLVGGRMIHRKEQSFQMVAISLF